MSEINETPSTVGRRPSIPFAAIGRKMSTEHQTTADRCPCCNALLRGGKPKVDLNTNTLIIDSRAIALRPKDAELLEVLLDRYPRVATMDDLVVGMWGHKDPASAYNCLKVYVGRVNKAIAGTRLSVRNVFNVGYRVVLS